jgi:DNA-binding protein Fis
MKQFFTKDKQIQSIIRNINITKTLYLASLIVGEPYIGKKTLAIYLLPNAVVVDGSSDDLNTIIAQNEEIIIINFEKIKNIDSLDLTNKRVIATTTYIGNQKLIDEKFSFIYKMPSIAKRKADMAILIDKFIIEAKSNLMIMDDIKLDYEKFDLKNNSKSLRKFIYQQLVYLSIEDDEVENILYNFLYNRFDTDDIYRKFLYLYERPLIMAGLKKFKSQLKLSSILGINRNTLRKKINELKLN